MDPYKQRGWGEFIVPMPGTGPLTGRGARKARSVRNWLEPSLTIDAIHRVLAKKARSE